METFTEYTPFPCFCLTCSYPTYEEWKLDKDKIMIKDITLGSYPTYEEWKQNLKYTVC